MIEVFIRLEELFLFLFLLQVTTCQLDNGQSSFLFQNIKSAKLHFHNTESHSFMVEPMWK